MRVGVVGCGLMGGRRARHAAAAGDTVVAVADVDSERARVLARELDASATTEWTTLLDAGLDAVCVCTTNDWLRTISVAMLEHGLDVLCEKPLGRNAEEAEEIAAAARQTGRVLKVGFNHRHHPAIARAHHAVTSGEIGLAVGIRAAYGHGGRPGYEGEWRCHPERSGGGELLDQGVHLVDLCRWFLGDFSEVIGLTATWKWPIDPLEDNAFALLRTEEGRIASIHTSWTQWRNLFRFEVLASEGYAIVEGLGGGYGTESLRLGRRRADGSVPDEQLLKYARDTSWELEWREFSAAVRERRDPLGSGADGVAVARLVDAIYASACASEGARQ